MVLQKSSSSPSMVFKVRRNPAELVAPAGPTPHELKLLSDIDDQQGLRIYNSAVQLFPYSPSMAGKDPVHVIREALSKALVLYYSLAGRLREAPKGKLMVDCTAEGVLFIEADADVTLEQFGVDFLPPFPCFDELLYHAPFSNDGIINSPLLLIQVTRLKCGGFIFAIRMNHTMCDGTGILQFIKAIAEIAQGASKPSIMPVWCRDLLCARDPPRVTFLHPEYQQLPLDDYENSPSFKSCHASFFFGPKDIDALRRLLPPHLAQSSSTFDILTAFLWRCHTAALHSKNPNKEVLLMCVVNARFEPSRLNPPLPKGYYGSAFALPAIVSTVGMLCRRPLSYALELAKKPKKEASEEYVRSTIDLLATKGRPAFSLRRSFIVSNLSKLELSDVDYGWGKPLYIGPDKAGIHDIPGLCYYLPYTNSKGEHGTVVLVCLPEDAMKRFENEINGILHINDEDKPINSIMSNL
ncbi:hypothetical protein PIB30_056366 [Stylosanthes scabra]|uniref:Uncharacterized protein n=1 Tax=Stylosanthes scabra TaxID=79078 RepID=A0ABU6RJM3_9FABA|nr:hypothetical protein [Stylosanthes scabra]